MAGVALPVRSALKHAGLTVARWFDSWAGAETIDPNLPQRVDWLRCLPFLALHAVCFAVIWVGWSPFAVLFALALYVVRMFAITGFYHRYFSHRSYRTSRFAQFVFGVIGNSAVQRGPLWWAAHHRNHHKHSDKDEDVHSPHAHSFVWSHIGWITSKANFRTQVEEIPDLVKYPELRFLDRFDTFVPLLLFGGAFALGAWLESAFPGLGTSGWQLLVWTVISTVVLFHGTCTINSLSHLIGRRRYETSDKSRNNWLLAIITLGEGWHNNHHYYPRSVRQGFFWWEYDLTYYGLRTLALFGVIWDLKPVPIEVRAGTGHVRPS